MSYRARVAQVLLVEDDPTIRAALIRGLGERGHAVDSAPTALAGLEAAVACDAAAAVRERTAFWAVLAEDTERRTTVEVAPGPLPVGIGRADLEAAVDALLGNVFAHTPDGTALAVRLVPAPGGGAVLTVADAGPGLPPGVALGRGASGAGSSGLGLDIARRAAEQAGGGLALGRSRLGGLEVVLRLGPPAPASSLPAGPVGAPPAAPLPAGPPHAGPAGPPHTAPAGPPHAGPAGPAHTAPAGALPAGPAGPPHAVPAGPPHAGQRPAGSPPAGPQPGRP